MYPTGLVPQVVLPPSKSFYASESFVKGRGPGLKSYRGPPLYHFLFSVLDLPVSQTDLDLHSRPSSE